MMASSRFKRRAMSWVPKPRLHNIAAALKSVGVIALLIVLLAGLGGAVSVRTYRILIVFLLLAIEGSRHFSERLLNGFGLGRDHRRKHRVR